MDRLQKTVKMTMDEKRYQGLWGMAEGNKKTGKKCHAKALERFRTIRGSVLKLCTAQKMQAGEKGNNFSVLHNENFIDTKQTARDRRHG